MSSSLFAAQGLLSRHNVPEGSFLVFAGIFSPVLVGLSSSFIAGGSFLVMTKDFSQVVVEDLVFLLSCDRRLGVPLELWRGVLLSCVGQLLSSSN